MPREDDPRDRLDRVLRERDEALVLLREIRPYLRTMMYFTRPDLSARVEALLEGRDA